MKIIRIIANCKRYRCMRKLTLLLCLFAGMFILPKESYSQDPEFTQFYANPLYLNPAFAGTARCPRLIMNYRNQWPAISGTFVTYSASYDQHLDAVSGGIGILITSDEAGQATLTKRNASFLYSYHLPVSRDFSFKIGFQGTFSQLSLDWSKLTWGDMIHERYGFVLTGQEQQPGNTTVIYPDFSVGLLGYSKNLYFGGAVHHLFEPDEKFLTTTSPLPMKITAHAGAVIEMGGRYGTRGEESSISPNILYQMQQDFRQLNLGMYVTKGPIVGGVWYRNLDAFIVLLGIQQDMYKFGYSYDLTISKLSSATAGSHELSFALQFDCRPKKKKFRTISCPSF